MGKSKGLTTVTTGLTGIQATGQLKDAGGGGKAIGYVDHVGKADAALGKAMGTLREEHMADYMVHTAPKHGMSGRRMPGMVGMTGKKR